MTPEIMNASMIVIGAAIGYLIKHLMAVKAASPAMPGVPAVPLSSGHPLLDLLAHAMTQPSPIRDNLLALILPALAISKDAVKAS